MGGLGNQMFQYAFGQLQKQNGIEVSYDRSWFDNIPLNNTPRTYHLDKLYIDDIVFSTFLKQSTYHEFKFDISALSLVNHNFVGYWQYVDIYLPIVSQLQEKFRVIEDYHTEKYYNLCKRITSEESIAIHVRRGDYLTTPGFATVPLKYYFEAIGKVSGNLFIFSDDISWCKSVFKQIYFSNKVTFVDIEEYLALDLMSLCNHTIIANSSFSSWAGFLNPHVDKIVIYPDKWTPTETERSLEKKSHMPKNWIRL